MPAETKWQKYEQSGDVPKARSGHTITAISGGTTKETYVMYGGIFDAGAGQKICPTNEVYKLTTRGTRATWTKENFEGDQPMARAQHVAINPPKKDNAEKSDSLFIYGGHATPTRRLNDCWWLEVKGAECIWKRVNGCKDVDPNQESTIGAPGPRANCGSCYYDGKIYIYGGHGGLGYKRFAYDDIYSFDIATETWQKHEQKQEQTSAQVGRGGNSIFVTNGKLYTYGGWNSESQYERLTYFDFSSGEWQDDDVLTKLPRWNHCSLLVEAIPSQKFFVFGGEAEHFNEGEPRAFGKVTNSVQVLDLESFKWETVVPESEEDIPKAREYAAMFLDKSNNLICFGGWNSGWMCDMYGLNVSKIVGPPYAITNIEPNLGQLSGGDIVLIHGQGFVDQNPIVYFTSGTVPVSEPTKYSFRATNVKYISDNLLECESPNYTESKYECIVQVSCGGNDITTTWQRYTFFMNTRAAKSLCYGAGILTDQSCNEPSTFVIQARNDNCENRQSGRDQFQVTVVHDETKTEIPAEIVDNNNGSYNVIYKCEQEGKVNIVVRFKDDKGNFVQVRGSPYSATFVASGDKNHNVLTGKLLQQHLTEEIGSLQTFMAETKAGAKLDGKNTNDVKVLISVKDRIEDVKAKNDEITLKLDQLDESFKMLQSHSMAKDKQVKEYRKLNDEWTGLKKLTKDVEKNIKNNIESEMTKNGQHIQKLEDELKTFATQLKRREFYKYSSGRKLAMEALDQTHKELAEKQAIIEDLGFNATKFGQPYLVENCGKHVEMIEGECANMKILWDKIEQLQTLFGTWLEESWTNTKPFDLEDKTKKEMKILKEMKIDKKSLAYTGILDEIKNWLVFLPLIAELSGDAMRERHWNSIRKKIGINFPDPVTLKLKDIYNLSLEKFKDDVEEVCEQSKQEAKMEKNLAKLKETWTVIEFVFTQMKDSEVHTIKLSEDDFELLEEHQMMVQGMGASRFVATFEEEINSWQASLGNINTVNIQMGEIQRTWSFLESLFLHSDEVKKELPEQSKSFVGIDNKVRNFLAQAFKTKIAKDFCNVQNLEKELTNIEKELKVCEKALYDFMATKQAQFPRFYFVATADLLDILSNGNNPAKIMKHMPKIFQAIETLTLSDPSNDGRVDATELISCVGVETVKFCKPLRLVGKVEVYMQDVIDRMRMTLKEIGADSLPRFKTTDKATWLFQDPAQITLLINMLSWVEDVEGALRNLDTKPEALKLAFERQKQLLLDLILMVRTDLNKAQRTKVMCLITMDAHSRDILGRLVDQKVRSADEFVWQAQLKPYWNTSKNDFEFKIMDACLAYGYEYLGNGPRLVVTDLTDRIYVTATQALHLKMGCAPAGPAGTGKTETTKDLSSCLAKAIYVFNCSDQMDYLGMGGIYKGLAASGSWGCFDEFNRLLPSVLSVCSVQFKAVTDSIRDQRETFTIEGQTLPLDPTCGVFITMNPGYLGRAELPEGLKALFRPITVVVPDLELICENMLMAEGFTDAKLLATKFFSLYTLCKDLLSKAMHYDWGLRAIKSVLVVAGGFKRAEPDLPEMDLLMRALRDFNTPKVVADDLKIFMGLLGDLFPGVDPPRKRDMEFETIIEQVTKEQELHNDPDFILKVVQLKELLSVRHCVFVMGTPGCGKTSTWRTLQRAQTKGGQKTTVEDLNPKVQKTDQLYGIVHPQTREWIDGLMSNRLRDLSSRPDTMPKWIVLDGDLDANWIESMNSVMDDNKILTLASNERIKLMPHMRLIFEIKNLKFATPATVSRAGILFISDSSGYQWKSYYKAWIAKMKFPNDTKEESKKKEVEALFEKYVEKSFAHMKKVFKPLIPTVEVSLINSLCKLLEAMYIEFGEKIKNNEMLFVFCCVWCFGAGYGDKDGIQYRKNFNQWWKDNWKTVKFGTAQVFEYYLDFGEQTTWKEWKTIESGDVLAKIDTSKRISSFTVPTPDTIAMSYLMQRFLAVKHSPMLIGAAGCGKTQIAKGLLDEITSEKFKSGDYLQQTINFNFYTDSEMLQTSLESQLEKRGGKSFGPKGKSTLIYFIDDLNMPGPDKYETQAAIALIRQHKDYNHWYNRATWMTKDIQNTMYLAAMNPTAGSFFINDRLQRHFWTANVIFPETGSLTTIYSAFMNKHFSKFKAAVNEQIAPIIKTTIAAQDQIQSKFRKTAQNFHYEFNVRHLTNVFQGLLQAKFEVIQDLEKIVKLWIHEMERIYGDRLVNAADLASYREIILDCQKKNFARANVGSYLRAKDPEPLVFANFVESLDDKKYDVFPNAETLGQRLKEALEGYNELNAVMDLVLFEDAMKHCCKIARIISADAGHALLVGVGGSGKQSLSRLATYISSFTLVSIMISSSYGVNELKEDLRKYFEKAGGKDEGLCFLFTEGQITKEHFLVYINDLLSSGEIDNLFDQEAVDTIVTNITPAVKSAEIMITPANCWKFFIDRVRRNLHMSLCFSPVGNAFRDRARKFPALVNCTVIDWFHPWPQDALLSVADRFLADVEMQSEELRASVVKFLPFSFAEVGRLSDEVLKKDRRYIYTTPKSFLELIKLFKSMLGSKQGGLENSLEKYEKGVITLEATTSQVSILQEEITATAIIVKEAKEEAQEQAQVVGVEKKEVDEKNEVAEKEAAAANKVAAEVSAKKASVQKDLDAALPLVEEAMAALDSLKEDDFKMLKSFSNPPEMIKVTMECTLNLFAGIDDRIPVDKKKKLKDDKPWGTCLKVMNPAKDFISMLKGFKAYIDEDSVKHLPQNFDAIRPTLDNPKFTPDQLAKASSAAEGVCKWVINITKYYDVVVQVEPKKQAVREAEVILAEAMEKKEKWETLVAELKAKLQILIDKFDAAERRKNEAEAKAFQCEAKLSLANRLVSALGAEGERWKQSIITVGEQLDVVLGDVLMASAFVSYIGPFNIQYRNLIMKQIFTKFFKDNKIPVSADPNPLNILTSEAEMASWQNEKLPSDEVSLQNGAILTNSERYPLMIDPQLQGITWIKFRFGDRLEIGRLTQGKRMVKKLQECIQNGKSFMIENLENSIDAVIAPVYARMFSGGKGKSKKVKMGEDEFDVHNDFKLIMHTKLSNPHYPPEIQAECTLINFTVTEKGLEDQLLSLVVKKERPDLAAEKEHLIKEQNEFKITIKNLEDDLLYRLVNVQGEILEDIELIENLEKSKQLSVEIKEKIEIAKQTSIQIDEASEQYRPAGSRGALVYFMMVELTKIHAFYKFSLESFIFVIIRAIDIVAAEMRPQKDEPAEGEEGAEGAEGKAEAEAAEEEEILEMTPRTLKIRVTKLIEEITYQAFDYVRRGTFEKHKLIVATMLTLRINKRKKLVTDEEEAALIKKEMPVEVENMPQQIAAYMSENVWIACHGLMKIPAFKELPKQIESEPLTWKKWYGDERAESFEFLPKSQNNTTPFHKLLLLRALRPDRLPNALKEYVKDSLGERYIEQPSFDMQQVYDQMNYKIPAFFVLFPGVDATQPVENIGKKYKKTGDDFTFTNISMGQGQEKKALDALKKAAVDGNWIMVQNVHLMTDWMKEFERALEIAVEDNCHKDFRVFISSEPPPLPDMEIIPESVLQNSIKVSNEAPQDLKTNIRRALSKFPQEYYDKSKSHKEPEFKALIFGLCMFHSLILGRRKFGAIGWSRVYNFNDGDLTICGDVLHNYLSKYEKVPYEDLQYIYGEIMYGGHITDDLDRRTNRTYLKVLIQKELMNNMNLTLQPGWRSPPPQKNDRQKYVEFAETLPPETPVMYGLHANAEIGYLTAEGDALFDQILLIQGGTSSGEGAGVQNIIDDFLKKIADETKEFFLPELKLKQQGEPDPFWIVCLQECERINILIGVIKTSLTELDMGLKGQLNITDAMDELFRNLSLGFVPGAWAAVAYFSLKPLGLWFTDMLKRWTQLNDWTEVGTPQSLWISGLFNPMSFLTAIQQKTARKDGLALDDIVLQTTVTNWPTPAAITADAEDGAYIHGFFLEGAAWDLGRGNDQGSLTDQQLKELNPELPVMHVTAIPSAQKVSEGFYDCPVYVTKQRGPTFVFKANLKMEDESVPFHKWILAGVSLVMAAD